VLEKEPGMIAILLSILVAAGGERDNRSGVQSFKQGDIPGALEHFEKAAEKDTANARLRYNRALARTLAGKADAAQADWDAARRDTSLAAKALYNRGTGALDAARKGNGDAKQAVRDLSQALRMRPGWKEAARNLELARRLEQQQKKDEKKQPDDKKDKKNDPKKDQEPPKPKDGDGKDKERPQPQPAPGEALSKEQADQMLQAAQAREQERRKQNQPKGESRNGKDW
jgi:tetratricopeptide (TPR) repeat protein